MRKDCFSHPSPIISLCTKHTKFTLQGQWIESTSVAGYLGKHYFHNNRVSGMSATFHFTARVPGTYSLYMYVASDSNRDTAVPIDVNQEDGLLIKTFTFNQRLAGGLRYMADVELPVGKVGVATFTLLTVQYMCTDSTFYFCVWYRLMSPSKRQAPPVSLWLTPWYCC